MPLPTRLEREVTARLPTPGVMASGASATRRAVRELVGSQGGGG